MTSFVSSPCSVWRAVFFSIIAKRLSNFLLSNRYIDTSVQKGGMPGIPGCLEHPGVVTQLIKEATESGGAGCVMTEPHQCLLINIPQAGRGHTGGIPPSQEVKRLILEYYDRFSLFCPDDIQLATTGSLHNCWMYSFSDPLRTGNKHAGQGSGTRMQGASQQVWQ